MPLLGTAERPESRRGGFLLFTKSQVQLEILPIEDLGTPLLR